MVRFAFRANYMAATYRALFRHVKYLVAARMVLVLDHANYFWDHVAAALNLDPVADLHAEAFDLVHVVKRCARYGRTADGDRLQRSDWREFAGSSNLHQDVFDLRYAAPRRVFVCDCPARRFAGEAEFFLQSGAVDLDDNAVDFVGKGVAFLLPPLYEGPDLLQCFLPRGDWD